MLPAMLAEHFTLAEVQRVSDPIPQHLEGNVMRAISALEGMRVAVGVPFVLTSVYRTPARNVRVGGSDTSDHPEGLAVDFKPRGISLHEFYRRFREADAAGKIPQFDQLILYPYTTGHIHAGFGARMRRQHLLRNGGEQESATGKEYAALTSLSQIPKTGAAVLSVLVVLALIAAFFFFRPSTH